MEIAAMINELNAEMNAIEIQMKTLTDRHDACKMAIESLELLELTRPVKDVPQIVPVDVPVTVDTNTTADKPVAKVKRPGHPKRVLQKDAKGIVLHEYRSVSAAAKAFGWTYAAMLKYIETTSRDRQIAIRGSYLVLAA